MNEQTYTCPMHPEIVSDKPGHCPKCGMALVLSGTTTHQMSHSDDQGLDALTWKSYIPLIVIFVMIFLASLVASFRDNSFSARELIMDFMTGFFLVFSGFKLMDIRGFAQGYFTYDILAKKWFGYGYIYPFIELGFGLTMLAGFTPVSLLWAELILMAFSGLGVAIKLARKEKFQCSCLGTFLKVPLTYVTLIEDFGMAVLALALILLR